MNIKQLKAATRMAELESLRRFGPQHGKAGTHVSKRDKARDPKRQRKDKSWLRDAA